MWGGMCSRRHRASRRRRDIVVCLVAAGVVVRGRGQAHRNASHELADDDAQVVGVPAEQAGATLETLAPAGAPTGFLGFKNVSGSVCEDHARDDQRCFIGVDYSQTANWTSEAEACWAHCRSEYDFELRAAHPRPAEGVCCCQSRCNCLKEEPGSTLALSVEVAETPCMLTHLPEAGITQSYPFQYTSDTTCGDGWATCSPIDDQTSSDILLDCWLSCGEDGYAVVNRTTCCCYANCGCLETSPFQQFAMRKPDVQAIRDCSAELSPLITYRGATCGTESGESKSLFASVHPDWGDIGLDELVRRCSTFCANQDTNATIAVVTEVICSCFEGCDCLLTGSDGALVVSPNEDPGRACDNVDDSENMDEVYAPNVGEDDDLPDDALEFEENYDTYAGISCDAGSNTVCFLDFNYSRHANDWTKLYECWGWCTAGYVPTYGNLASIYGDPTQNECCCVSDCPCFDRQPIHYLLALRTDITPVPLYCSVDDDVQPPPHNDKSKKKKTSKVGPVHRNDLWWIVLIVIVGGVACAFFVAVEEMDKHRRDASNNKKASQPSSSSPSGLGAYDVECKHDREGPQI